MTLTLDHGPFSPRPPHATNYSVDGPAHKLVMTPFPRRVRAEVDGEVVLDSERGMLLHETAILPRLYVPLDDVRGELLEPSDTSTHCPFKGDASYWSVRVGARVVRDVFWGYESPNPEAAWLPGSWRPTSSGWTAGSTRTRRSAATCATPTTASTRGARGATSSCAQAGG